MADDSLSQVRQDQANQVKQFRANIPGYANTLYGGYETQAKQNLAQNIANMKQNASSRGLLYGGLQQGAQAAAVGAAGNDLQRQQMQINQDLGDTADKLEQAAVQSGLQQYQGDVNAEMQNYQRRLQAAQAKQSMNAGIFGGMLGAGGKLLGGAGV